VLQCNEVRSTVSCTELKYTKGTRQCK